MELELKSAYDEFNETVGSKIWPSSDPSDSPFNKFECKHCKKVISIQMYGSIFIGSLSFDEAAKKKLRKHLLSCAPFLTTLFNESYR